MMTTQTMNTAALERTPWPRVGATVALLTVIISVVLTTFAWSATRTTTHDVPIAVVGPQSATRQVAEALQQRLPGAFDITEGADTAAADALVRDRKVYGVIDLSTGTPHVIIASAASPLVAQTLQQVVAGLASGSAPALAVDDLAPLSADDPRGAGLAAAILPVVMGGLFAALLFTNLVKGTERRLAGVLTYAVIAGLAMTSILQLWLGALEGNFFANAGVLALSVAAVSLTILGLESLLGFVGFILGATSMMIIGNPLSGATSAPEMLPGWSGTLGQFLPPGAGGSLLRSTAFFDGHGAAGHLVVLLTWLVAGTVLMVIGGLRTTRRSASVVAVTMTDEAALPHATVTV
jgi:hypothetical protein